MKKITCLEKLQDLQKLEQIYNNLKINLLKENQFNINYNEIKLKISKANEEELANIYDNLEYLQMNFMNEITYLEKLIKDIK